MTTAVRRLRRVRTQAIPSYLVVAQSADLDDLRLTLSTLPMCAHGRVVVVAEAGEDVPVLQLPARMSVTVRTRKPGEAACDAAVPTVRAWASEMLCAGSDKASAEISAETSVGVLAWVAGSDESFVDKLSELLCAGHGLPSVALRTGSGMAAR